MIIGCACQKDIIKTKDDSYEIKIVAASVTNNRAIIYGYIYDEKSKNPVKSGCVRLDGEKTYISDTAGKYVINLKPGRYRFQGQGYGYYWPTTKKIKISQGDKVREQYSLPQGFYAEVKKEVFGSADKIDAGKNQNVAKIAAYVIKKSQPQLMTIHLFSVDHAEHMVGRHGAYVQEAVKDADDAVGIITDALKAAGIWENTVLFIGGDDGFYDVKKTVSPNVRLKEAGLMNDLKSGDWKAQFNSSGGSAYLYLKNNSDQATIIKVKALLDAQPDSVKQYYRLISKKQLTEGGFNPNVAFALTGENDAAFSNASTGQPLNTGKGGTHRHFADTKQ